MGIRFDFVWSASFFSVSSSLFGLFCHNESIYTGESLSALPVILRFLSIPLDSSRFCFCLAGGVGFFMGTLLVRNADYMVVQVYGGHLALKQRAGGGGACTRIFIFRQEGCETCAFYVFFGTFFFAVKQARQISPARFQGFRDLRPF